jgi:hypothetical protein
MLTPGDLDMVNRWHVGSGTQEMQVLVGLYLFQQGLHHYYGILYELRTRFVIYKHYLNWETHRRRSSELKYDSWL